MLTYVRWLDRRARWIFATSVALLAASIYLVAFHLPLYADFSYLLPRDAPAVRDLATLEARRDAKDTMLMLIVAPDAASRAAAMDQAAAAVRAIEPDLVARVDADDADTRAFIAAHRDLYVPLADLTAADHALAARIKAAKLAANPLYVDFDDDAPAAAAHPAELDALLAKRHDAEAKLARSANISADGKTGVAIISTAFHATDIHRDQQLQARLDHIADDVRAAHPDVRVGFTGGVPTSVAEQRALVHGVALSSAITAVLVALVLFVHLRNLRLLLLLTANIAGATLVAFGLAALTVGHLNAATAFLGAIIAGNGVNYGILLVARYLEERGSPARGSAAEGQRGVVEERGSPARGSAAEGQRGVVEERGSPARGSAAEGQRGVVEERGSPARGSAAEGQRGVVEERPRASSPQEALAAAIAGTLKPTLVASLAAAIAYGALAATHFRGFADFAWIGGAGMLVCWVASFVLLPTLILRIVPTPRRAGSPLFGALVVRAFGFRRPALVCALAGAATLGAAAVSYRYATHDPFEYDMTQLRSAGGDAQEARRWMRVSDDAFGRGLAGMAGQTYIAVDREADVPVVVDALHELAAHDPIIGPAHSILDVVPADQPAKLAVLASLRAQLDAAGDAAPADVRALRPAEDLRAIAADLPPQLARKLTEKDGRVGLMVSVRPGAAFDEWNGHDLIAFAWAVRQIRLSGGRTVATAGPSVLFADVITTIQTDGPRVTFVAAIGLVLMVLLVVGPRRRGIAVLIASSAGTLGMIAVCAIAGLKVNFLDFVALPITLGLGVDYAINVADRASRGDPGVALRSTGGTVLVCSLTTVIGYTSLLVSENLAIRGFGLASLIGEITCVLAALVIVPAVVSVRIGRHRAASDASDDANDDAAATGAARLGYTAVT